MMIAFALYVILVAIVHILSRLSYAALYNLRINVVGGASFLLLYTSLLLRRLIRHSILRRDPFRSHPPLTFGSVTPRQSVPCRRAAHDGLRWITAAIT